MATRVTRDQCISSHIIKSLKYHKFGALGFREFQSIGHCQKAPETPSLCKKTPRRSSPIRKMHTQVLLYPERCFRLSNIGVKAGRGCVTLARSRPRSDMEHHQTGKATRPCCSPSQNMSWPSRARTRGRCGLRRSQVQGSSERSHPGFG